MPQLTLANEGVGGSIAVEYTSGSGSSVLTFVYNVSAGEVSSDLGYVGTSSLTRVLSTVKDVTGNDATLTLPDETGPGSLKFNKQIVIDGDAPTVLRVVSSSSGKYGIGSVVDVQVEFDEGVVVSGGPQIGLETGSSDGVAVFVNST